MKRIFSSEDALPLRRYTGSPEEVYERYKNLLGDLGKVATEAERYREIGGRQTDKASHRFIYPPEERAILTSNPGDNSYGPEGLIESKNAKVSIVAEAGVGVELDMTEPPVLSIYDISPSDSPLPPELGQVVDPR